MGFGGAQRQVPYAVSRALNTTNNQMQTAVRASLRQHFIVRRATFIDRMVKIKPEDRATKQKLKARLRIEGPEGSEFKGDLLIRHEEGGTRQTAPYFFIPTEVLRFPPQANIPQSMYPKALRLESRKDIVGTLGSTGRITRRGTLQLQGKRRTFILNRPNTDTPLGIFQRKEGRPGRSRPHDIALIWYFVRTVHLKQRLQFGPTTKAVYEKEFTPNVRQAFADALRTAR